MYWLWRRDGHTLRVELGMLTGRETVILDGAVLRDVVSWRMRNELPVPLPGAGEARVAMGLRHGLPDARLLVEGIAIAPDEVVRLEPVERRALIGALALAALGLLLLLTLLR